MSQQAATAVASGASGEDLTEVAIFGGLGAILGKGIEILAPIAIDFIRSRLSSVSSAAGDDPQVAQEVVAQAEAEIAGLLDSLFRDVLPVLLNVIKGVAGGQAAGGPSEESAPVTTASRPQPQRYGR